MYRQQFGDFTSISQKNTRNYPKMFVTQSECTLTPRLVNLSTQTPDIQTDCVQRNPSTLPNIQYSNNYEKGKTKDTNRN